MIDIIKYATRDERIKAVIENKAHLIAQKKFDMKRADAFSFAVHAVNGKGEAIKAVSDASQLLIKDAIDVVSIINTTNLMDSHDDVHINGLWKKSLKEQKNLYLLQEHEMKFDKIISDEVKASTKNMSWKELGFDVSGDTEALIFKSTINKTRNPFMFEQYAKGYVKNHSVGMRYVQLYLCVNDDSYAEEKIAWDKYISQVVNRKQAEARGYFWAVTEAKIIEGSAVVMGSNWITPTQSIKSFEPSEDTQPSIGPASPPESIFNSLGNKL